MKIFYTAFFVFVTSFLFAQKAGNSTLYLKNGSIIKGTIINSTTDSTTTIVTRDGNKFVYNNREVERTIIDNVATTSKHNNFWLGANIEPQIQGIFKSPKEIQNYSRQYPDGSLKRPASGGVQTGFKLSFLPPGIAGFETGLQYHYYQAHQTEQAYIYNYGTETLNIVNKYHNLEIPVYVCLHTQGQKVRFYSADGLSVGVTLAANHSENETGLYAKDTSFTTHLDSTSGFYCTVMLSAGVQISIAQNMLINISTTFRISSSAVLGATNAFYSPNPYPFVPYSIGLNIEILFKSPGKSRATSNSLPNLSQKY
jgi:hypothetical protein